MARGQVLNNNIDESSNAQNYNNAVNYLISNDKETCDAVRKVTKSLKQQEKIKTKIDTIYDYEERSTRMGSRKRNRWINDNFINHPIARELHYESQDIHMQYPLKSPSPFTKLVNLCQNGINISSFIDINDDRQRLFLKRISKYTNTFMSSKEGVVKAAYGSDHLTRLDRRLKQNLMKKPQYKQVVEDYEKNIRLILLKIQKEQYKKQKEEEEALHQTLQDLEAENKEEEEKEEKVKETTSTTSHTLKKKSSSSGKKKGHSSEKKKKGKKDLSEKLVKLGQKIQKEKKEDLSVVESRIHHLNQKYFMVSWKIESEFHRLIVHSICRWYGLPSYSMDKEDGRYTYIEINPNEPDLKERLANTFVKYIYA